MVILHSKDLVNWQTIGAAMTDLAQIGPDLNWDRMNRYNEGVYAPSLRYHDGKFFIFVNVHSGEGFYCCTATNPAGPWTVTQIKDKNGKPLRTQGWTDPCPLWDDDGKAYLASSHPSGRWFGYLFQMKPDGSQLLDADVDKMNAGSGPYDYPSAGTLYSPFDGTEGNKLFKRFGYYYLVHIEFRNTGNGSGTYVMRSKNLYGTRADGAPGKPGDAGKYELLKFGQDIPGQGGFVDTPDGRWFWIGQLNSYGSDGRKPCLLPVTWIDDWPVPGADIDPATKKGKLVWQLPKPITGQPIMLPQGSDEFNRPVLDPKWSWNYQPRADKWSLTARPGFLRLAAFKPAGKSGFFKVGNVISQRHLRSEKTAVTVKLDVSGMVDGQEGGLARFNAGRNEATLGVVRADGGHFALKYEEDGQARGGPALPLGTVNLWLRTTVAFDDASTFAYSLDGQTFMPCGGVYKLRVGNYRGDRIGIYTFNPGGEAGVLDADFVHYEITNR